VYVGVPPLNEVVVESVALWPLSMVEGETLMAGTTKAGLTVTKFVPDKAISGGDDPAVTPVSVTV
jgi:hypothetical protein